MSDEMQLPEELIKTYNAGSNSARRLIAVQYATVMVKQMIASSTAIKTPGDATGAAERFETVFNSVFLKLGA